MNTWLWTYLNALIRQVERLITIADVCFTPYNSVTHLGPTYFLFSHGREGAFEKEMPLLWGHA